MSDVWNKVCQLKGKTLYTSARNRPFDIIDTQSDRIIFTPQNGNGTHRWATRKQIETMYDFASKNNSQITSIIVQEQYPSDRNTSYIASIINTLLK